jgi:hypothetical protein
VLGGGSGRCKMLKMLQDADTLKVSILQKMSTL